MSGIYRGPGSSVAAETVNLEGDKGDITVSNAGETWTIDPNAVTFSKIQNVATDTLLGRSTSGTGNVETITCTAAGRALLDDANAAAQRTTLGITELAAQDPANVDITGGSIVGITDLAVSDGGTGASSASDARTNLGLVIGANVLAYDANLQSFVNTFTLPTADSSSGFYLKTDGAGNLGFQAPGGIGDGDYGDITVSGGGAVWSIDADTITTTELANNAVETANITDLNVTTGKLADLAVTTSKLNDLAVTNGKIASDAVTTSKILDGNVTTAKVADEAVTPAKLSDSAFITIVGDKKNLIGTNNSGTPNSQFDIDADEVILKDTDGRAYLASNVNLTANIAASGANGLDTGAEANSTWYYLWVIYNGTTVASLISTSSTAPTMPSGYTYKALVGFVYNDSGGNFIKIRIVNNKFYVTSTIITTTVPTLSYVSLDLSLAAPPIAKTAVISGQWVEPSAGTTDIYYSPNNSDDLAITQSLAAASGVAYRETFTAELPFVTAQTIYYKRTGTVPTSGSLKAFGGTF
jgi:hypothetical protein